MGRGVPQRLSRSLSYRLSPRYAFIDIRRVASGAVVVLGSARSGTTKLAEILAASARTRLISEPLHPFRSTLVPPGFTWGGWVSPDGDDPELHDVWRRVLTGNARSAWTDRFNRSRVATRRVVKSVAGTNLVRWLQAKFPSVPIVYLVRNPFAVASSIRYISEHHIDPIWRALEGRIVDDLVRSLVIDGPLRHLQSPVLDLAHELEDPFGRTMLRWCLENVLTLTNPPSSGFWQVSYEDLVSDPTRHIGELGAVTGLDARSAIDDLERPSATDYQRGQDGSWADRRDDWRERVTPEQLADGGKILSTFALDGFVEAPMSPTRATMS